MALLALVGVGCSRSQPPAPSDGAVDDGITVTTSSLDAAKRMVARDASRPGRPNDAAPLDDVARAVLAWNNALAAHDLDTLAKLYADDVRLYGKPLKRKAAVAAKAAAFKADPSYTQSIASDVTATEEPRGRVRASFVKLSTAKGEPRSYASYLVLLRSASGLSIVEESDKTTDENLAEHLAVECIGAAAGAVMKDPKAAALLAEPVTADQQRAGCRNHGLMPFPPESGDPKVAVKMFTSCDDRQAFRGWFHVGIADGCVYEEDLMAPEGTFTKLSCDEPAAARVRAACRRK
ncbi:MAG: hypothetical protein JWO86_3184 [Myxococcaceae bacterium]|nr:hypothetical protein [Myxococcaceae bacterium]